MNIDVLDQSSGEVVQSLEINDKFFNREYNPALVQQVVTAYQANKRQATRAQKSRSEVKHSTKKPWRQKGTGRARAGMTSSPLWRGGGRAFPARTNENFKQKVNKKMFRAAMSVIFSQLIRDQRLVVLNDLSTSSSKTKDFVQKIKTLKVDENALFITEQIQQELHLSSRNIPNVLVLETPRANPVSLLKYKKTFLTTGAIQKIQEQWS